MLTLVPLFYLICLQEFVTEEGASDEYPEWSEVWDPDSESYYYARPLSQPSGGVDIADVLSPDVLTFCLRAP